MDSTGAKHNAFSYVGTDETVCHRSLEAEWNARRQLRELAEAQDTYERHRVAAQHALDAEQHAAILNLANDVPQLSLPARRHWPRAHSGTPFSADLGIGLLLPCNVVVYDNGNNTSTVEVMDPEAALGLVGDNPAIAAVAREAGARLHKTLEALSSS